MDFTLEKYKELLNGVIESRWDVYPVKDWIKHDPKGGLLLRHDVDRFPARALSMAILESQMNISSTYYFRIRPCSFQPEIIRSIADLGHEIGYHYEDLSSAKGNTKAALTSFTKNLQQMRRLVPIETVAMHGSPLSSVNNRDLWQDVDADSLDLVGDAVETIDYTQLPYVTDTGRNWSDMSFNVRDTVDGSILTGIHSTDDLIRYLKQESNSRLALSLHPERWTDNLSSWTGQWLWDVFSNKAKQLIHH